MSGLGGSMCLCESIAQETWVPWKLSFGAPSIAKRLGREALPSFHRWPGTRQNTVICEGAEKTLAIQFRNRRWDSV